MTTEVLQEYLVKLGYAIDEITLHKFNASLSNTTKGIMRTGSALVGMGVAVEESVEKFAYSMRKMYFSSELAGTSATNLKSMEFAGKQVGISSDALSGSLTNMTKILDTQPNMRGWLRGMGIGVKETKDGVQDVDQIMIDLVKKANTMPENIGASWMEKFGMGWEQYHLIRNHTEEFIESLTRAKDAYQSFGMSMDDKEGVTKHYATEMDALGLKWDIFKTKLGQDLMPAFDSAAVSFGNLMDEMIKNSGSFFKAWEAGIALVEKGASYLDEKLIQKPERDVSAESAKDKESWSPKKKKRIKDLYKLSQIDENGVMGFYQAKGWTKEQAAGITAQFVSESGLDPFLPGDKNKKGEYTAFGIGQWHKDRQANYEKLFGHRMQEAGKKDALIEQLEFGNWELNNTEKKAGDKIKSSSTAREAGVLGSKFYERPAAVEEAARNRGVMAERFAKYYKKNEDNILTKSNSDIPDLKLVIARPSTVSEQTTNASSAYQSMLKSKNGADSEFPGVVNSSAQKGANITQTNNFHITGDNAKDIANNVSGKLGRVNADTVRQFSSVMQ
jgi:hypothetical protein